MSNWTLYDVLSAAIAAFHRDHPRAYYALEVLAGRQRWSGADLRGRARQYSWSYSRQRDRAARYLVQAGGTVVALYPHGLLSSAIIVGTDDYGNEIYETTAGVGVAVGKMVKVIGQVPQ